MGLFFVGIVGRGVIFGDRVEEGVGFAEGFEDLLVALLDAGDELVDV